MQSEESGSFLKKRTKKFLLLVHPARPAAMRPHTPRLQLIKVFCFFFSKKKRFLSPARYAA
jgi:hypothetical protein